MADDGDDAAAQEQAQAQAAQAQAFTRFERGKAFTESQDYAAALAEFEAAYRLTSNFVVVWYIAVSQKNLFRYADALETLKKYLRDGGKEIPDDKRRRAEMEIQVIRGLMAELLLRGPKGAKVVVDDRAVGAFPFAEPLLLGPGTHKVVVTRPGFETKELSVRVVSGEKKTIDIELSAVKIKEAQLSIRSKPAGASLSIDNKRVGKTPWSGGLRPGGHRVRAVLKGYVPLDQEVVLTAGQIRPLSLQLVRAEEQTPFFKRWYVWAAIGAVAVGGGATYLVLSQEKADVTIPFE